MQMMKWVVYFWFKKICIALKDVDILIIIRSMVIDIISSSKFLTWETECAIWYLLVFWYTYLSGWQKVNRKVKLLTLVSNFTSASIQTTLPTTYSINCQVKSPQQINKAQYTHSLIHTHTHTSTLSRLSETPGVDGQQMSRSVTPPYSPFVAPPATP